jgi:group II intron reverse transcriptase/maturase
METTELMEKVLDRNNLNTAYLQVKRNKGSHGIDKMTIDELLPYLKENGQRLIQEIREGSYKPKPVRRVEIPKPSGGKRMLGIPSVIDRLIQQAIAQVITPYFEEIFSDNSFGFRPGRSTHDALKRAKAHIEEGNEWVVDIDLEKFFDRVNHDMLMARVARVIKDKSVLKLIRKYLNSGVLVNGIITVSDEGTPQGGPLSPLLSNIMLDDLDKELKRRNLAFVRYADDVQIYVKSPRAAERVMEGVTSFIEKKLKLKVNREKTEIGKPF